MEKGFRDIALHGVQVKLVAMQTTHKKGMVAAAADGNLWELLVTSVPSQKTIDSYVDFALAERMQNTGFPFVVIDKKTDQIIGSTRYCNADFNHRRVEIGWTWYAQSHQRTGVNTECKYLLLGHAFDTLNCACVQLLTHSQNHASIAAISRLGAKQDGILRNHRILADGSNRDSVVFSIIDSEWPEVKRSLEEKMRKYTQ